MVDNFGELEDLLGVDPLPVMGRRVRKVPPERQLRTHCAKGHPLSGDNLGFKKRASGKLQQICKTCAKDWRDKWNTKNPNYMDDYYRKKQAGKEVKPRRNRKLEEALERIEELECALKDVLVYAPDYMHGMPKKHYEKIAWRNYNGKA